MISGNGGNDSIQAGDGIDSIWPGDGDDTVDGGDGGDSFNSSPGADTFIGGGGDQDQMFYSGETADLNVSLDGVANDGAAGEHDNVSADFDYLFGGSGNDTLVGSASGQMIGGMDGNDSVIGGLGADDLSGGQGNDTISYADRASGVNINSWYQQSGETGENDTIQPDFEHIIGGAGNDTIAAMYFNAASDFSVDGGAGNDSIQGNLNGGTLIGGAGSDYLNGYDAVDTMRTRDGEADQVNCGGGSDSVISDPVDTYPNGDCESIDNVVDTTPPPLTITSPSGGTTNAQYVTLQFTTEAGATTTCALNSGTPASCSYNDAIGPLVEGLNTVTVTAKDAAGNATTKTAQVTRDTIPPQTYLDSFSVNDPTATATFHASEAGAELQYSLDSGAWTTTNSPFTTPALSNGSHTLQVRAKDIVNNADQTPVSKTFNISVPGKLSLTSATSPTSVSLSTVGTLDWAHWGSAAATSWDHKSGVTSQISNVTLVGSGAALTRLSSISPSSSWTGGTPTASSTTSTAATGVSVGGASGRGFSFTVPGGNAGSRTLGLYVGAVNTTAKVELSLGDSSAAAITDTTSLVSTSSTAVNKLITISYRPVSSSSNLTVKVTTQSTGSVRLYAATLAANTDTTAPNTSITVPSTDGTVITTPTTSATITSTETGGTLQCKIDSGDYSTVASPYTTPSLQDGLHTLRCRAIDAAGNIDATPAVRTFWISTPTARLSAPAPTIQTAAVNLTTEGTLDWTHYGTSSASLTPNRKSGANVIGAVTQLGGGTLARLTSGVPGSTWTGGTPTSSATNSTTALSYNTTSPGVIGRGFQFSVPALPNQLRQLKLYVGVTNTTGKLEASLDDGSGLVATETSASNAAGTTNVAYTITFRASAASKNLTVKWTQNTTAATGRVSLQSATLVNNPDTTLPVTTITSGPADGSVVTTSTATFGFSSNESGSSFQCRMDETIYLPCANPFTTGTLSDGQHTFDVRAVDAAGNIASQPPRRTFTKQ
jgi:hypothetical protein